ncbi:cytochrome-c peroxidase [Ignatzschineria cameli]|uniref:Cytochrome-c peroxidase n=1 Tax=Ignatzschineria cameli TaxID=2182793 RepID=A0ABX5KX27_9GAMM|nr:cytochrome c peroxidase [Ignatzschineria cameli]PWD83771.1 cytochrome-c peroxidase [Ignatzschineria cameli]PWD87699.1 cytochrome-c peroxidase [Ignatzschineria cameli]PWD89095.1 cytochrome-c peroxidase [Ignatzschineria cameli]PWD90025.1 cytochrome-c peroxidase [Ignatzschineria cameli]
MNIFIKKNILISKAASSIVLFFIFATCNYVASISVAQAEPDIDKLRALYNQTISQWPEPFLDDGVVWKEFALLPSSNRDLSDSPMDRLWEDVENSRVVALGARLFTDSRLSRSGELACISCHQPDKSFSDGRALAIGEDGLMGRRRSMTLFGSVSANALFWDGRAATLEEQVLQPISDPREMDFTVEGALDRLDVHDQLEFYEAFGQVANRELLARSLSAYIASLRPPQTVFDQFLATKDSNLLSDQEVLGMHLFRTKARCMNCHSGPLLTDQQFHNIGLSFAGRRNQDLGRYEITKKEDDLGKFRTPSLRGVSKAGPWMHNGIFPTLKGVISMYNAGMPNLSNADALPYPLKTSEHIQKLELTDSEIEALLAFLKIL